jgi:hypothetical protein
VTLILEDKGGGPIPDAGLEDGVDEAGELGLAEVAPGGGVAVGHLALADHGAGDAALALEDIVGLTNGGLVHLKEVTEAVEGKVPLDVLGGVDDARAEGLLVGLALEDLLLDGAGGDEAVDEAGLPLSITPHTGKGLLISRGIPIEMGGRDGL